MRELSSLMHACRTLHWPLGELVTEEGGGAVTEPLPLWSSSFRRKFQVTDVRDPHAWSQMSVAWCGASRWRRGIVSVATVRGERAMCGGKAKRHRSHSWRVGRVPRGEMNLLWGRGVSAVAVPAPVCGGRVAGRRGPCCAYPGCGYLLEDGYEGQPTRMSKLYLTQKILSIFFKKNCQYFF